MEWIFTRGKNFPENCNASYVRSQSVPIFPPLFFSVSFSPLPVPLESFTLKLKSFAFWKQAAKGESNLGSTAIPITVCFEFVSSQLLKHSCWPYSRSDVYINYTIYCLHRELLVLQLHVGCQCLYWSVCLCISGAVRVFECFLTLHGIDFNFPWIFHDFFANVNDESEMNSSFFWLSESLSPQSWVYYWPRRKLMLYLFYKCSFIYWYYRQFIISSFFFLLNNFKNHFFLLTFLKLTGFHVIHSLNKQMQVY